MTTPTKHLETFDEKHWSKMIKEHKWADEIMLNDIRQHLIQTVISVLEEQIEDIETITELPPPYNADQDNPKKHWYQNEGYRKGLVDTRDSLTTTLSTWKALL